jgi:hypothetical protein
MNRITGVHDDTSFSPTYIPEFTTPEEFIDARVEILREHLKIELTEADIAHLREYRTEGEINAAIKGILNKYWQ